MTVSERENILSKTDMRQASEARIVGLSRRLSVTPYGDDEIFITAGSRSGTSKIVRDPERRRLLGGLAAVLAAGPCATTDAAAALDASLADIDALVEQLIDQGIVTADGVRRTGSVFIVGEGGVSDLVARALDGDGEVVAARVATVEDLDADELLGVGGPGDARPLVVLCADVRTPGVEQDLTLWSMETDTSVLRACVDGDDALVGPIVIPGQSACLNCYDIQDEATRSFRFDYLAYKAALDRGNAPTSTMRAQMLAAGYAAVAIADHAESGWGFLVDRVVHVNVGTLEISTDRVFRVPRCPVCIRYRADLRHTFL